MRISSLFLLSTLVIASCSTPSTQEGNKTNESGLMDLSSPASENASLPHLVKGGDNNLYLSWVKKGDSNWVEFKYSMLDNDQWTEPELISKGNDWFVNWADYPQLSVDKDGNKIAHFLAKSSNGTYSYDVNVVIKPNTEEYWSPSIIPHKDGTPTEHGFVTMLPQNDGTFLLSWLDGRNTGGGEHSEEGHGTGGAMTIRTAVLDMKGNLTNEAELDARVCDCCQTGATMTQNGPIIVYRDRSEAEIRDMAFVKLVDGIWSEPQMIANDNWNIPGCPVNGPRITALGNGAVSAWFTAAEGNAKVKMAFMTGDSFDDPIIIDETSPIGRVDVIELDETTAMISWLDNEEKSAIKYRKVSKDGTMSDPSILTETSDSRGSGFPQMEKVGDQVYFAWTNLSEEGSSILLKKINLK
jgi:hypothetical protein